MGAVVALGAAVAAGAAWGGGLAAPATPVVAAATTLRYTTVWTHRIEDGRSISLSSPIPATLERIPSVVVGSLDGKVYAFGLAHGGTIPGWPAAVPGGAPVATTPSVGGGLVYVGTGNSNAPTPGGYLALHENGKRAWYRQILSLPAGAKGNVYARIQASMTYGVLQDTEAVTAGSMGQYDDAFRASDGATLPGFPWYAADSEVSTPAIADLYANGVDEIVEGGDSTAGLAMGKRYTDGGHIRVLRQVGHEGYTNPSDGLVCQYGTDQVVESSPAVGPFLAGHAVGITVGTGTYFRGASETDDIITVDSHCRKVWIKKLDGSTHTSPALVAGTGPNQLQIAMGTAIDAGSGYVYLLNGSNGAQLWRTHVPGEVIGSITSAALSANQQDLLVPTTSGLVVLDAADGSDLTPTPIGHGEVALMSSPLVTDDAGGTIGVTVAGYNSAGGIVIHYGFPGSDGKLAGETGAWPMFHRDPQLTGTTLAPVGVR